MGTRFLKRFVAVTMLAGGLAAAGAAAPAAASVNDAVLHATDQSPITAACTYSAEVYWDRASGHLSGSVSVTNYNWFAGCFKRLTITLIDDEGAEVGTREIRIATTCGTKDPGCAPAVVQPINEDLPVSRYVKPYVDHMNVVIQDRAR